ncbi:hypothetical protein, partial [Arthrobacter cheniae]|uniref:hypothetical protein n=1 Tax=Arthrobacter cheniae TaxID=1258888 RepID=UPI001C7DE840
MTARRASDGAKGCREGNIKPKRPCWLRIFSATSAPRGLPTPWPVAGPRTAGFTTCEGTFRAGAAEALRVPIGSTDSRPADAAENIAPLRDNPDGLSDDDDVRST